MSSAREVAAVFNNNAKKYQDKFMDQHLYHDGFDLFCESVSMRNATLLETGCGPGNVTQYLLNRRPDFRITGIDLAVNMLELARINNPTATFQMLDCRDIRSLGTTYDAILCGFCLPYLSKEEALQFIKDAAFLLKEGGVLYISTMEDEYAKSGWQTSSSGEQLFMYYHQADYLVEALAAQHFDLVFRKHQDFPTQDGTSVTDLILIAKKTSDLYHYLN
jgi:2-polyprenyl-3-methyl-5-hydroxy-6-metoxy-1,4-benzoquinol methylase